VISEIDIANKADFYDKFIKAFKSPSFGALPKKEVELLVLRLLIEAGVFGEKIDSYILSRELCIPVSKAKTLYYEYQLRNCEESTNYIIELLKTAQVIIVDKRVVIQVGVDSLYIKNQLEATIKELNDYPDYSFNKDILKFSTDTYLKILSKFCDEQQIEEIEEEILKFIKESRNDNSYTSKSKAELFNIFLEEAIRAAGKETGKLTIDLTFGCFDAGSNLINNIRNLIS